MKSFSGFPAGKVSHTPLPNLFFTELLPLIDDVAELKVTLHIFWRLYHMRDYPRCVSHAQLAGDTTLLRSLNELGRPAHEALAEGLERAVARGTFLKMSRGAAEPESWVDQSDYLTTRPNDQPTAWYFPNTAQGRWAVERIQAGELELPEAGLRSVEIPVSLERPNVFLLYERNIGALTQFIAEQLRDAEQTYPAEWIEDAFRIAVEQNVRKWAYVRGILERWATKGRDDGTDRKVSKEDPDRYISGEYADYIEH
jgi:DnaD/phage-associated family protein